MDRVYKSLWALTGLVVFAAGCNSKDTEQAGGTAPQSQEQVVKSSLENNPNIPPEAKQSAIQGMERAKAQSKESERNALEMKKAMEAHGMR